jgi:hypothetical protein
VHAPNIKISCLPPASNTPGAIAIAPLSPTASFVTWYMTLQLSLSCIRLLHFFLARYQQSAPHFI